MIARTSPNSLKWVLVVVVVAQFAGTSLWFAGNAVMEELIEHYALGPGALAWCTMAVQTGFITGTFLYAFGNFVDRYSPKSVFLVSAAAAAWFNLLPVCFSGGSELLYISRMGTGFFLAGIYPVGMKIAADWFDVKLGRALGYLVGALVVGTAFPHLLRAIMMDTDWTLVLSGVSAVCMAGAILLYATIGDGPHRVPASQFKPNAIKYIFEKSAFRSAAAGYFGHMWELYTFWAFVPVIITSYAKMSDTAISTSFWSFVVIALGALGCISGGHLSHRFSSAKVALVALATSAFCCFAFPVFVHTPKVVFLAFLCLWGTAVVADSPQFSALNARTAPREWVGSALTIATCIGFAITIVSIRVIQWLFEWFDLPHTTWVLAIGPVFGIVETVKLIKKGW